MLKQMVVALILAVFIWPVCAQSHLDLKYELDAMLVRINTDHGAVLRFEALQHPLYDAHASEALLRQVNEALGEGAHPMNFDDPQVVVALPGVVITDPMNERQIVEMLLARAGLSNEALRGGYEVEMDLYRIDYSDHRLSFGNVHYTHVSRTPSDRGSLVTERYSTLDWKDGLPVSVSDFGGKKLLACIKKYAEAEGAKWEEAMDSESMKRWLMELSCETTVQAIDGQALLFLPESVQQAADMSDLFFMMIAVPMDCFTSDRLCGT
jgi:hypothetical protein